MNDLAILLDQNPPGYTPGAKLSGTVRWQLPAPPQVLSLQLLWFTSGKGSRDLHQVASLDLPTSQPSGTAPFQFTLPDAPYSFSGKYISLQWTLELIAQPGNLHHPLEFILSPSGREIVLPQLPDKSNKLPFGLVKTPLKTLHS